jgi:hypothetical protein
MACYVCLLGHENGMAAFAMSGKQLFRASQRLTRTGLHEDRYRRQRRVVKKFERERTGLVLGPRPALIVQASALALTDPNPSSTKPYISPWPILEG